MVRIRGVAWVIAAAVTLAAYRPALADPITLTSNVASDFTTANGSIQVPVNLGPGMVTGPTGSTAGQLVSGVDIQNIWVNYNATTDSLDVGIQGYKNVAGKEEIFGDDSGNTNPALDANPNFGGLKSFAIAFAPLTQNASGQNVAGTPTIIAGIPQDKSQGGTATIDGFTVTKYSANGAGLPFSFGTQIPNSGNIAYNPSAAQPDMEFTINNFSKISGVSLTSGFYIEAYSGTPGNQEGKLQTSFIYVPPVEPQNITTPEPTTWLLWGALAGGAAYRFRRSRRTSP
ncbi:MAG: hypothetical protein ACLQGP_11485 [Isosphaeraceae bacterium]